MANEQPAVANEEYLNEYTPDFVSHWDQLIGWEGREEGEGGFFRRLLGAQGAERVLDAACGTGFHSVILSRDGFKVTAADGSSNMLRQTGRNADRYAVALEDARVCDWLALGETFPSDSFDSVVCLGNAFTHLFDHEARRLALREMYKVLKPGGLLVVDHRNYDRLLAEGYSTKHQYYYTGKGVNAHPIEISDTLCHFEYTFPNGERFYLKMYPLKQGYMRFLLEDSGYHDITTYGDFARPFDEASVDFIQQVAFKPRTEPDTGHPSGANGKSNGAGRH